MNIILNYRNALNSGKSKKLAFCSRVVVSYRMASEYFFFTSP